MGRSPRPWRVESWLDTVLLTTENHTASGPNPPDGKGLVIERISLSCEGSFTDPSGAGAEGASPRCALARDPAGSARENGKPMAAMALSEQLWPKWHCPLVKSSKEADRCQI